MCMVGSRPVMHGGVATGRDGFARGVATRADDTAMGERTNQVGGLQAHRARHFTPPASRRLQWPGEVQW